MENNLQANEFSTFYHLIYIKTIDFRNIAKIILNNMHK